MAIFDSGGVQIYYQEHGAGDPVVLVHGFASHSDNNWGPMWFTFLAPHFRVIAIDCRGHGKSGKPHDAAAYGAEKMGDDVIRLLDHLKIQRALLMGYSMGGRISMVCWETIRSASAPSCWEGSARASRSMTRRVVKGLLMHCWPTMILR